MKAPSKEICSKSTILNFLLKAIVAVLLTTAEKMAIFDLYIAIFAHCIVIVDPQRRSAQ